MSCLSEYDCCLTPSEHFSAISWREQVTCQCNDGVYFVLDQSALMYFFLSWLFIVTTVRGETFFSKYGQVKIKTLISLPK